MNALLQAMRIFHYMVGITAPARKDERKVLVLWIVIIFLLIVLGVGFAFFISTRIFQ